MRTSVKPGIAALTFALVVSTAAVALAQEEGGEEACSECPGRETPVCCTEETCLEWVEVGGEVKCNKTETYKYYYE